MAANEYALRQQGDAFNDNVTGMLNEVGLLGSSASVARSIMGKRGKRAEAMLGRGGMQMDRREPMLGRISVSPEASNILVLPLQELAAIPEKEPDVYANAQVVAPGVMYFGGTEIAE